MIDLSLVPHVVGYVIAGVFGAIIGSFLNVVIHRVPLEESIVFPNSRCPSFGAVIGGGSLWLMGWTWEKLRGIEAMGLGDVKMMFMVGAYLGWRLTILTIFVGVLTGSIIGIALMARQRDRNMQMLLPFGVFLGLGAVAALLFGVPLVEWYAGQFR